MERFTAVADEHGLVRYAFEREQEGKGKTDDRPGT
jgi:hypothetical protein